MRLLVITTLFVLMSPLALMAQNGETRAQENTYFGMEVGHARVELLDVGLGGEWRFYRGLGMGSDIGYVIPRDGDFGDGIGLFSVYGLYQFGNHSRDQRWTPFVLGGYSMGFRNGVINGINFGGGVTRWMNDRIGVRFEGRRHRFMSDGGFDITMLRFGLSIR